MMLRELCFPLPAPGSPSCYSALPEPPMPVDLGQVRGNLFMDLCAGVDRPLSAALLKRGVSVLSIDVLLDERHDLLSDAVYERLLRLAFSGAVVLAHASPPSSECGSSGLRVDSGSQVINPQGCPQRGQLTPGRELLVRCTQLVLAVYIAGGHSTLLQLATALSWEAPEVQAFLKAINADACVCVRLRVSPSMGLRKQLEGAAAARFLLRSRAACSGVFLLPDGEPYLSCLQKPMRKQCCRFSAQARSRNLSVTQIPLVLPCKEKNAFPRANQDGGGIFSYPDWSVPPPGANDVFRDVRHALTKLLLELRAPARLRQHVADKSELPLFTASEVQCIRDLFQSWMLDQRPNAKFDWSVPDFQPYCLSALACLSEVLGDKDIFLFQSLLEGIPTGFAADIPKSHVFVPCGANGGDLAKVPLTSKRVWMRVSDARSVKRKLSDQSRRFLRFWQQWATSAPCLRSLSSIPRDVDCVLAADAFAHGSQIGIGGFLQFPGSDPLWFSERFCLRDFAKLRLPLDPEAQRNITCWEAMAQLGLVLLFSESVPGGRMRVCVPSFSDNTGAEASCNKLLTTSSPLCFLTQQLALVSWWCGVFLDVQHIAGFKNGDADYLSRWDGAEPLRDNWDPDFRVRMPIAKL